DDSDNSNTQFGLLALWVGRRHGMPADFALWRTGLRFRGTQQKSGSWAYEARPRDPFDTFQRPNPPTATMTAVGLIGLAVGNSATPPKLKKVDLSKDPAVKGGLVVLSASLGEVGLPREKLVLPE